MTEPVYQTRANAILAQWNRQQVRGAEIGVARGKMTECLLNADPNLFLYLVDLWAPNLSPQYVATDDKYHRVSPEIHEGSYLAVLERTKPFADRVKILRMHSVDAAQHVPYESLDWVFIDADHSYEGCSADILAWVPNVRHGGMIAGHDYREERGYGVVRAVQEFAASTGRKVTLGPDYTWFMVK